MNLSKEFKKIDSKEFDFNQLDSDLDAAAVVLFDIGDSRFIRSDDRFEIKFTRTKRIKILSKAGIEESKISILLNVPVKGLKEELVKIEAFTYNEKDDRIFQDVLDPTTVYEERVNDYWKEVKFTFPNVQVGSVLEYKVEVVSPFIRDLRDWGFQSSLPTLYSKYNVRMIPFYEYSLIAQGLSSFDFQSSVRDKRKKSFAGVEYVDMIHTYVKKDIPAFKSEQYIASRNNHIMKLDFPISKS